ncbi:hypothetical protein KRE31_01145 [Elizabethkingia meningoseptica]|uniref:hypothetical protein n=1 Tax=Elizabethkingia meningoseptica TaxID=238 RepID=UPI0023B0684B|nr:hypothetical protein [Elizabethkingia meningoseptica]MDE5470060.1 hypothetical protein [Elizabethkingia meningoseptica]
MILINKIQYTNLLGKNKQEIIEILGEGISYYPDNYWFYDIKKYWWGKKKALLLIFGKDGCVKAVNTKNYYFISSVIHV